MNKVRWAEDPEKFYVRPCFYEWFFGPFDSQGDAVRFCETDEADATGEALTVYRGSPVRDLRALEVVPRW